MYGNLIPIFNVSFSRKTQFLKPTIMKNLLIICLVISLAADSLLLSGIFGLALYTYNK